MSIVPTPSRGEVWLVNFDPAIGSEVRKVRPALVMNPDSVGRLPLRIVVPITDWKPHYLHYPWFVQLQPDADNGLSKESGADAFQVKSISLLRFVRYLGFVPAAVVDEVAAAVAAGVEAP